MSSSEETLSVIREVFSAFAAHDVGRFRALLAEDAEMRDAFAEQTFAGPDEIVAAVSVVLTAMPDLRVTVANAFAKGDRGVAEVMREGTNTGPLRLPDGEVPPTGRAVRMPECVLFRVRQGKVVSMTAYADQYGALAQLGLVSSEV